MSLLSVIVLKSGIRNVEILTLLTLFECFSNNENMYFENKNENEIVFAILQFFFITEFDKLPYSIQKTHFQKHYEINCVSNLIRPVSPNFETKNPQ